MAISGVNATNNNGSASVSQSKEERIKQARKNGEYIVTVSGNETGLYSIAKKFNMSVDEFKRMTGLKSSDLKREQVIKNVPHAQIPAGWGLNKFAEKYGMTLEQLRLLNNLPKGYQAKAGEHFYIFPENGDKPKTQPQQTTAPKPAPVPKPTETPKPTEPTKPAVEEADKVTPPPKADTSAKTPAEIAQALYNAIEDNQNAIAKEAFTKEFLKINEKNAKQIIQAFEKIEGNDKSLIKAICVESSSDSDLRMNTVMELYDNLAKQTKQSNPQQRQEFQGELKKEFDKWFGYVNTEKLDETINKMIVNQQKETPVVSPKKSKDNSPKVILGNGKTFTALELQRSAIAGAKKDKGFSRVKPGNLYIVRPLPNINENGRIEAASELHLPTNKNGSLKNKVIIVNPGHGGYGPKNGFFDAGTVLSVKNAEGKEMAIEEWRTAQSFAQNLVTQLQAKGATVVVVSGAVGSGGMYSTNYLENLIQGNKGSEDIKKLFKKTKKSDMAFISIHADSDKTHPEEKSCSVRPHTTTGSGNVLAKNIQSRIAQNISCLTPDIKPDDLYVTRAMGEEISAVLLEVGNIANENIKRSLLSGGDIGKYNTGIVEALEMTLR